MSQDQTLNVNNLVIDMDGVLWHGDTAVPGIGKCLSSIRDLGVGVALASNNSTKTAAQMEAKLAHMGIDLDLQYVVTSANATVSYLKDNYPQATRAYVIGEDGLHDAVQQAGLQVVSVDDVRELAEADNLTAVDAVVGGLARDLTYDLLAMGALLVRAGVPFIASNIDASFPSELGQLPGAGAVLDVVSTASGVKPIVVGKPEQIIFQGALKRLNASPDTSAMIGDRLETAILGAQRAGMTSILVLSGVSTKEDIQKTGIQPDYVFEDIHAVAEALQTAQERV
ncbi:MAG: HAD-IIA family hydrolase [Deinococcota bacterium]